MWFIFLAGLFVGALLGVMVTCVIVISGEDDPWTKS